MLGYRAINPRGCEHRSDPAHTGAMSSSSKKLREFNADVRRSTFSDEEMRVWRRNLRLMPSAAAEIKAAELLWFATTVTVERQ